MPVVYDGLPVGIHKVESQAAKLGALAAVGAPPITRLTDVTLPAITHAQRPVDEDLEQRAGAPAVDTADFVKAQLTGEHHLAESGFGKKLHLLRRAVVHLRAGMQGDRRQVQLCDAHILYDKRIHPDAVQVPYHRLGGFQFVFFQDGIHRNVNAHTVQMGITHQCRDVVQRVSGSSTCSETGCPDIHGIRSVVDGFDSTLQVLGRSQQFDSPHRGDGKGVT